MTESPKLEDLDPVETQEWLESIDSVLKTHGPERAHFLLERLIDYTRRSGAYLPFKPNTAYVNTIPTGREPEYPGNRALERRIEAYIRWNALAMVLQANKVSSEYGGHLASYASSATLYEVGFNHFWRAPSEQHPGDMVFIQGHSSPGIYARAYLEGRLTEEQLRHFRQEAGGPGHGPVFLSASVADAGLLAVPDGVHGPGSDDGDLPGALHALPGAPRAGEALGPEGLGVSRRRRDGRAGVDGRAHHAGARRLDNLIFVINCNLQRLDGPVRGNGKIIQELEAAFLGAGWNVIKVLWGSRWDPLLARDTKGLLRRVMEECVDGEYQNFKAKGGAYTREHFFGKYPGAEGDGRQHVRRGDLAPQPRRPRSAQGVRGLRRGHGRTRASRPSFSRRPSRASAWARAARARWSPTSRRSSPTRTCAPSATASTSRSRTRTSASCRSASRPRTPTKARYLHEKRSAAGRLSCRRGASTRAAAGDSAAGGLRSRCWKAPASARSPPPWRSCAC